MSALTFTLDPARAQALAEAVAAGDAASLEDGVNAAVDAWLLEQTLAHASDAQLQTLWAEGEASGRPEGLDVAALKAQARLTQANS